MRNLLTAGLIVLLVFCGILPASETINFGETSYFLSQEKEPSVYWIFLDRRDTSQKAYSDVYDKLDSKAIARRIRARGQAVMEQDLPPHPADLEIIINNGLKIRTISKWLNAVSVVGSADIVERVVETIQAKETRPVVTRRADIVVNTHNTSKVRDQYRATSEIDSSAYGLAWIQNELIHAPEAHEMGFTGEGVRVGFLDTGYRGVDDHVAFDNLEISGRWNAYDSTENVLMHNHGSHVLSVTAAQDSGFMIGVAPDIQALLVKTEDTDSEYVQEEDRWVAGLEWAEEHGADLISTSLGYYNWYSEADMDGNTAITTIAADLAAARGLLVITSAGNAGADGLGAPADGDSVLTVGATDSLGSYALFSSMGPTADGRIKPDVSAMGLRTYVINDTTEDLYRTNSGTSFSCPAVAGACALLLQADPELLPADIIRILHRTSSQADVPDIFLGWGIVNISSAINYWLDVDEKNSLNPEFFTIKGPYPNPTNSSSSIIVELQKASVVRLEVYDILGRMIHRESANYQPGHYRTTFPAEKLSSGIYYFTVNSDRLSRSGKFVVLK